MNQHTNAETRLWASEPSLEPPDTKQRKDNTSKENVDSDTQVMINLIDSWCA